MAAAVKAKMSIGYWMTPSANQTAMAKYWRMLKGPVRFSKKKFGADSTGICNWQLP